MHIFNLNVQTENTSKDITVNISDNGLRLIKDYSDFVTEIRSLKAIQTGFNVNTTINWSKENGLTWKVTLPQWDMFITILHRIRPFVLKKEKANFYKIRNILRKSIDDQDILSILEYNKNLFSGRLCQNLIRFHINDVLVNSEDFLNIWLNAFEYHRDQNKRKFVEELHKHLPLDVSKAFFVSLVIDKVKAILNLCGIIDLILGKITEFNVS